MPEVARDIIKEQVTIGGNAMHTRDRQAFLEKMLMHSIDDYLKIQYERTAAFFDQGIPDLQGYAKTFCNMEHQQVNNAVDQYRYCQTAFIFPPWKEIYINDKERHQDYNESIETYAALKEAYELCGYHLIEIPLLSMEYRVDFILRTLTQIVLSDLHQEINRWLGFHDREYPRFCPDFDKNKLTSLINLQLDRINTKA